MPTYCVRCGERNKYAYLFFCTKCIGYSGCKCKNCGDPVDKNRKTCSRNCSCALGLKSMGSRPRNIRKMNEIGNLKCSSCKKYKPKISFSISHLKSKKIKICSYCKECASKLRSKWNQNQKTYLILRVQQAMKRRNGGNLPREWAVNEYDRVGGLCHYTGIKMTFTQGKGRTWSNASIDRIDNSKGYTIDNCVLCCVGINLMKHDLPIHIFEKICRSYIAKLDGKHFDAGIVVRQDGQFK